MNATVWRKFAIAVCGGKDDARVAWIPKKPPFESTNENIKLAAGPALPDGRLPRPCEESVYV
ncbi:hypothetical protein [Burkholderia sp. Z1]|uniref:hypothetical protein n=1 Tax=Burkholderia sp. Z1 TaxID=2759039 RepID=UPI00186789BB|nr:hypothetical protein [Burkholderia sp. Z1]